MNENLTAQHDDRGNKDLVDEYASTTGVDVATIKGALRKGAACLRGAETITVTFEELDAIRHLIPPDVVDQSYAGRWVTGLIGPVVPEISVFDNEEDALDSDAWPQLVYSGDWWSVNHKKEFPGTWRLYYGDPDSNDGCLIHDTKIPGLAGRGRALTEAKGIVEAEARR